MNNLMKENEDVIPTRSLKITEEERKQVWLSTWQVAINKDSVRSPREATQYADACLREYINTFG